MAGVIFNLRGIYGLSWDSLTNALKEQKLNGDYWFIQEYAPGILRLSYSGMNGKKEFYSHIKSHDGSFAWVISSTEPSHELVTTEDITEHADILFDTLHKQRHNFHKMFVPPTKDREASSAEYHKYDDVLLAKCKAQQIQAVKKSGVKDQVQTDHKHKRPEQPQQENTPKPPVILEQTKIEHLTRIKKALDSYIAWMKKHAVGTRVISRWSHWHHGGSGKKRAQETLDLFKQQSGDLEQFSTLALTKYDEIMRKVYSVYHESGIAKHSLSRYIHAALSVKDFSDFNSDFEIEFDDISYKSDSEFKREKNLATVAPTIPWDTINKPQGSSLTSSSSSCE